MKDNQGGASSVAADWLAERCNERGSAGIAGTISALILGGDLAVGARLPTVKAVADALSVSPNTVALAWKDLRQDGVIETHRRGGTFVSHAFGHRARRASPVTNWAEVDLARGASDPELLPPLDEALLAGLRGCSRPKHAEDHMIEPLIAAVAPTWPFACEGWTTAAGGSEGNLLAVLAAVQPGGVAAIEQPTAEGRTRIMRTLGISPIGVGWDDDGPSIPALEAALAQGPSAFVYQPRAHLPLGLAVTSRRLEEMAAVLRRHPQVWIIEDDALGPLAGTPAVSLGRFLPAQTLHVRTYCRAFGGDVKVCVLGGAGELVERIRTLRSYGTSVTSRILQGAAAHLLTQPKLVATVERARLRYARRRGMMVRALRQRGLDLPDGDGVVLWLPVPDESGAISRLARRGVVLAPGSHCFVDPPPRAHLRLGISRLPDDQRSIAELAEIIMSHSSDNFGGDYE